MMTVKSLRENVTHPTRSTTNPARALWCLWLTIGLLALAIFGAWLDRIWHLAYEFEDFFSPPHLIIYAFSTLAAFVVMGMVFYTPVRRAFGEGFNVVVLPFHVPGALVLLGGALGILGFAGLILDNFWHTNFGLDETAWSFPHAMLGWSILLVMMALLSARLALADARRVHLLTKLFLIFIVAIFSLGPFLGPLADNRTIETLQLARYVPVLANQPEFMHTQRIYETANLTRTNPLILLLAPVWFGALITFIQRMDRRWWVLALMMFLWWVTDNKQSDMENLAGVLPELLNNQANYAALPVLLPTLMILIGRRWSARWSLLAAAVVFNLMIYTIWLESGAAFLLVIPGAALALIGARMGDYAAEAVQQPDSLRKLMPLFAVTVGVPLITGIVDLVLRSQIA